MSNNSNTPVVNIRVETLNEMGDEARNFDSVDNAAEYIVKEAVTNARFVYINGTAFMFNNPTKVTPSDLAALRDALSGQTETLVTLSGDLVGGAV